MEPLSNIERIVTLTFAFDFNGKKWLDVGVKYSLTKTATLFENNKGRAFSHSPVTEKKLTLLVNKSVVNESRNIVHFARTVGGERN